VSDIAEEIRGKASKSRGGREIKAAKNKYVLNRIPWPLRRPIFRLLKWITVDMGIEIKALGLSAHSFGSFVVSDIGTFGLNTGMTALMPAAKIPCVIVLGKVETGTFDHRIVDGMQIGKLARGIKRNFRKPEWLDQVPEKELEACIFSTR
jgi:pyruvate dehydrogenase E2 component (dihydrolipoamide acetyltransferase)